MRRAVFEASKKGESDRCECVLVYFGSTGMIGMLDLCDELSYGCTKHTHTHTHTHTLLYALRCDACVTISMDTQTD